MKYPIVFLGCAAAMVAFIQPASAKSAAEIEAIARSVSVEMISGVGSGVLVHRQGDLYTVVTNRHVVCKEKKLCDESGVRSSYQLKTNDGQKYQVGRSAIKLLKDAGGNKLDLAIVQFRSSRNYAVAQVAEPGSLRVEDAVYTAGFPKGQGFLFGQGEAQAVVNKRLVGDMGGYTVVYDANTLPGMSGGGAFNKEGRLVAIHGQGDKFTENTEVGYGSAKNEVGSKTGYNRGIPIRWLVQGLDAMGIVVGNRRLPRAVQEEAVAAATAGEFFIDGFNKVVEPGRDVRAGREEAVRQFSRAIALNPKYIAAYYLRAYVSILLSNYSLALADYNQVIALDPKLALAYYNRGLLKVEKLNDPQGALADFNQSISLDPQSALTYYNRGILKKQLNDYQGALADYNQAISLNPKYASAYNNRGVLKDDLNDYQGALADYNQAIALNPKYGTYFNRGLLKQEKLNDFPGALADYNQAIALNPDYADAYVNRGVVKYSKLNDRPGGIQDLRTAARLFRSQGNPAKAQQILDVLRQRGVSE